MQETYGNLYGQAAAGQLEGWKALGSLAESGDAMAMFLLGRLHDVPTPGIPARDIARARSWYEQAAAAGHAGAQFALGNMFDTGEGAAQDPVEARRWYELAANQGESEAQMHLGKMLQTGRGGAQSLTEAASWYAKAVEQGHELAATNLGLMHFQKTLPDADDALALRLFEAAAEKLDGLAHLMLARMCLDGRGTETNGARALFHLCIASRLLPGGGNFDLAREWRECMLDVHPELREEFEADAAAYIASRQEA